MRIAILTELRRRLVAARPAAILRVNTELDSTGTGEIMVLLPGEETPADDQVSRTIRDWEITIGISRPVAAEDFAGLLELEGAIAMVQAAIERDRRLGGLLCVEIERGEIIPLTRPGGGDAMGVTLDYKLQYATVAARASDL